MADTDDSWALDSLEELVVLESPSGDVAHLDALRDVLVDKLSAAGADVRVRAAAAGDHLDALVPGKGDGHIVVLGHYDTVWPVGRLAESPFTVTDECATGPGVFDMKGGLVALLWALHHLGENPPLSLRIVLTADEEVGSPSGGSVVTEACDGAVAVFALEPPLARGTLKVGRRGVARIRLATIGREAHAGLDAASGVSALDELVDHLVAIRSQLPTTPSRSINVGRVEGGTRANVVAGRAAAELGLRFSTGEDEQAIMAVIHGLTSIRDGATMTVESLSRRPAWEPSQSKALADHVLSIAAELGEHITTAVSGGAGDANLTGALGIQTVDGLGPRGKGAHSPDETIELPSILRRARLLRQLFHTPLPG